MHMACSPVLPGPHGSPFSSPLSISMGTCSQGTPQSDPLRSPRCCPWDTDQEMGSSQSPSGPARGDGVPGSPSSEYRGGKLSRETRLHKEPSGCEQIKGPSPPSALL